MRHVRRYLAGCETYAQRRLQAKGQAVEALAERVHQLVRGEGYLVYGRGVPADRDYPTGSAASSFAAAIAGGSARDSWGTGATANRELARYYRADLRAEDYEAAYEQALAMLAQPALQPDAAARGRTSPHGRSRQAP